MLANHHHPQGHGDPERDYQLLTQAAADAAAAQLSGSATKRQRLLGGAAAESAVGGAAAAAAAALTPASARGKAGGLTPRDVFDDINTPRVPAVGASAGDSAGDEADGPGGSGGTIKSHRMSTAAELAGGDVAAAAAGTPPLTARSDVFDFLNTPRTDAGFAPPQVREGCLWGAVGFVEQ